MRVGTPRKSCTSAVMKNSDPMNSFNSDFRGVNLATKAIA
jgi:hypothetical protein